MDHNIEHAKNMTLLLCVFEHLSGVKINFHKSELFCYGDAKECQEQYTELFGCDMGKFHFKYLGILMHHKKISNADWKIIEEKLKKDWVIGKGSCYLMGETNLNKFDAKQSDSIYFVLL
jgi:hypothetical protein